MRSTPETRKQQLIADLTAALAEVIAAAQARKHAVQIRAFVARGC